MIDRCASLFDWAKFRRTKGAVKLHLLLEHDGYLPCFAVITEGRRHEVKVAHTLTFPPGTILVIDRGYTDYRWFAELTLQGIFFVTRMKDNAVYTVVGTRAVPSAGASSKTNSSSSPASAPPGSARTPSAGYPLGAGDGWGGGE